MTTNLYERINKSTILDVLSHRAIAQSEQTAYTFLTDDLKNSYSLSYSQLHYQALEIARSLQDHMSLDMDTADTKAVTALLMYPSGLEFIAGFFGCLYAGIIAVPVYPPASNRHLARLRSVADDCNPKICLTSQAKREKIRHFLEEDEHLRRIPIIATDEKKTLITSTRPVTLPASEKIAMLQYTSGSTGSPKGVVLTHGNLIANAQAITKAAQLDKSMIMFSWLPIFHDLGLFGGILQTLYVGAHTYFMSPLSFLRKPNTWLMTASKVHATDIVAPNFAYALAAKSKGLERPDLSTIRTAWNGAEPIWTDVLEAFDQAFSDCGWQPENHLPCYGLAEATLLVNTHQRGTKPRILSIDTKALEKGLAVPINNENMKKTVSSLVSCGVSYCETRVAIVDTVKKQRLPELQVGEIWIQGSNVAQGYWNNAKATEQTFHNSLKEETGYWLRSGDLGFLHKGELYITGRLKDVIIIRGRNLYPQDLEKTVETILETTGPNFVAAFSLPTNGSEKLALVIEANRKMVRELKHADNTDTKVELLMGKIRKAIIDGFHATPNIIVFVPPGKFPRTSSGKVQRRACRNKMLSHRLDVLCASGLEALNNENNVELQTDHSPTSDLQAVIRQSVSTWLFENQLGEAAQFTDDQEFATLGVDSLGGAQIAVDISKRSGLLVTPEILYANQTIHKLATYLSAHGVKEPEHEKTTLLKPATHTLNDSPYARYITMNQRANKWKTEERYFFAPEISKQDNRWVQVEGKKMLMLGSYNYLGLLKHEQLNLAAINAIDEYGTGHHGARLLAGTTTLHLQLEQKLAKLMSAEDAIVYSSGYVTNLATIDALVGKGDVVIGDQWNHASIIDGCRFSGAEFHEFLHNDMDDLRAKLEETRGRHTLVVIDAVYSMEGDIADLPTIVELCREFKALLMVDEAHSIGVLGKNGKGIQEHFNLPPDAIDIKMGTLSKALGSSGGFVTGKKDLIFYLRHHARGYIFSGTLPMSDVAAASASIDILNSCPELVERLRKNKEHFAYDLEKSGFDTFGSKTPIVPIATHTEEQTLEMTRLCRKKGLFVVPVFYPAVPMNAPRLRTCVLASHTQEDIDFALQILEETARLVSVI